MPFSPKRPCKHIGCPTLSDDGWCSDHRVDKGFLDRQRGSAYERGYTKRWQQWRLWYLRRHPVCVDCLALGKATPATEVHHIRKVREFPELQYDESNCLALDKRCHSARTQRGE